MSTNEVSISIRTNDGLALAGTVTLPEKTPARSVLLVHGGGVTREEGGFFARLADALSAAGSAVLRYDLRGHGESDGLQQDATLAAHLNDLQMASNRIAEEVSVTAPRAVVGASFGGGLAAYYSGARPAALDRLVLLNPQLNYKNRYIDAKPNWNDEKLDEASARQLRDEGYIQHSPTVKHGRAFLNDVFWLRPTDVLDQITAPTLIVHGTKDTFVPVETSREAVEQLHAPARLVEIDGAQHGFAVHEDPNYLDPQTGRWQASVIDTVRTWIVAAR